MWETGWNQFHNMVITWAATWRMIMYSVGFLLGGNCCRWTRGHKHQFSPCVNGDWFNLLCVPSFSSLVRLEELTHECYGTLCFVLYSCLYIWVEQCILWSNNFGYFWSLWLWFLEVLWISCLTILATSQLIISELGFGSGALWLCDYEALILSWLSL